MSTIEVSAGVLPKSKPFVRPATLIIGVVSTALLLLIALHVINAGYIRRDIEALQNGEAWQIGGWLSQIVLRVVSLLDDTQVQQTALSLIAAAVSGVLLATLYDRLRASGWVIAGAVLVLAALSLHAGSLYILTANSRGIPLLIAFAVLIPAIRRVEDTGDVQSAISMGLLLPLLLLASPVTTPLLVPFAIGAALFNADARRDPRAFVAMLLVTILPTLIVAIGILGFVAQARLDLAQALLPYVRAYSDIHWADPTDSLLALVAFAPVMIVPIAYCFWPGLPERKHIYSALAVIVLPLYLVFAREFFTTVATTITPPLTLLAAFVSWLAVVRLPTQLRLLSFVLLVLAAVASWTLPQLWSVPDWQAALLSPLFQAPLAGMDLRPGL